MLLPVESVAAAKALIDRGVAADRRMPRGTAYLVTTSDSTRNSRAAFFPKDAQLARPPLAIRNLNTDALEDARDVMFYLTGRAWVDKLDTLRFLPGALADHLTSAGGDLLGSGSDEQSALAGRRRDGKLTARCPSRAITGRSFPTPRY